MKTLSVSRHRYGYSLECEGVMIAVFPDKLSAVTAAIGMVADTPGEYSVTLHGHRPDQVALSAMILFWCALVGLAAGVTAAIVSFCR